MVLEQDPWGHVSHRAADFSSPIGEGLDPVLQFILLEAPSDPDTAQVLWVASETPILWSTDADDQTYRFVEYAVLPEDAKIEYRVYAEQADTELKEFRHERNANSVNHYFDSNVLDALPSGEYNLMARMRIPGRPMQVITQRVNVVDGLEGIAEALDEPVNGGFEPPLPPPVESDSLVPGTGWNGPTTVPKQIGNNDDPAIAHWNIVPEQEIEDGFTVGVIAHHLDGIDYVEISANNGPWVRINNPSVNPRTQSEEYWTALDLKGFNGPVELRAIAIPKQGKPVLVTPLGGRYSKQDLTLYPFEVGDVLELDAGEHKLKNRKLPERGWLIVRPKPGVSRDDVVLVDGTKDWEKGRLKLENLTIKMPKGGSGLRGRWSEDYFGQHIWLDGCRVIGNGPKDQTWWTSFMWETSSYTNTEISDVQTAFHSNVGLVRNCHVHRIYEDVFRMTGLHVNVTIENVDRQPMVDAKGLKGNAVPHPDLWQRQTLRDTISQDITAVNNINAQGFFPRDSENVALVRVHVDSVSPYRAIQMMGKTANVLIEDCKFMGGANFRGSVEPGERLVFRDTIAGNAPPFLPHGWDQEGIEVYPKPGQGE
ncbi:MAG: hypothetical protein AAF085_05570 [Planctomycetota bacterium]